MGEPGQVTILIAEDEAGVRHLLEAILQPSGWQLLLAADGLEALRIAQEYPGEIHLLFSDVVMPEMNGIELARRLERLRPQIKILLSSAFADQANDMDPRWRFLRKPFTPGSVVAAVRRILSES